MKTEKAQAITVRMYDQDVLAYLMPDGSIRLSKKNVCDLYGVPYRRLSQLIEKKVAETLLPEGLEVVRIATDDAKIDAISLTDAATLAVLALTSGYSKATVWAVGSMIEAFTQLVESAAGIEVSQARQAARINLRLASLDTRKSYTDLLKDKLIEQYGEAKYRSLAKGGYFRDVTILVNNQLFQQSSFGGDRGNMTDKQLRTIQSFEDQMLRRSQRHPEETAEQLLNWMLDNF